MTSMELDARRMEISREIMQINDIEEINARIDEAEADIDAGRVYSSEQVHKMMEAKYPWLCK